MEKITREHLEAAAQKTQASPMPYIKVGMSSCGIAAGAQAVFTLLAGEVEKRKIPISVRPCGCGGACYAEPLVEVFVEGLPPVTYGKVTPEVAMRILDEHVRGNRLVQDFVVDVPVRRLETR
jgi:(2Fe-2S) ferredoxin